MRLPSLEQIGRAAFSAVVRFPFTVVGAVTATVALMWLIEDGEDPAVRLWMTVQLGIPLLLALEIAASKPALRWGLPVLGIGLLVWYHFMLNVDDPGFEYQGLPRFFGLLAAAHLLVSVIPFVNHRPVSEFWTYNKNLLANWLLGAAYAIVLYLTLSLAILAVDQLFHLDIDYKIYAHLFCLLAFLFVTLFFLHHFPVREGSTPDESPYSRGFTVLCKYILIPVILLYFIILSAYLLKILFQATLPQGYVSYLVLFFAVVGILTYLLNYRLPEVDSDLLPRWFKQLFWWMLLPAVVLLLVSIGRRISDYGVTEPRYAIATAGAWLLGMCAYFLLSRKDNIKVIPITLSLVCLFVVVGPFNAFRISEKSQLSELRGILEAHGRWVDGKMRPSDTPILKKNAERVQSILRFFEQREKLNKLQPYVPVPLDSLKAGSNAYFKTDRITAWLKLDEPLNSGDKRYGFQVSGFSNFQYGSYNKWVNIKGFADYYAVAYSKSSPYQPPPNGEKQIRVSDDGTALVYGFFQKNKFEAIDTFDLNELINRWTAEDRKKNTRDVKETEPIQLSGKKMDLLMHLHDARIEWKNDGNQVLQYLNAAIFVRPKK